MEWLKGVIETSGKSCMNVETKGAWPGGHDSFLLWESDAGAFSLKPKLQKFGQDFKAVTLAQREVDCKYFVKYLSFLVVGKV